MAINTFEGGIEAFPGGGGGGAVSSVSASGPGIVVNPTTGAVLVSNPWGAQPATTNGDLLTYSGAAFSRLGVGTAGQVLTIVGGLPAWAASAAGFSNPMTTLGDLIAGGAAGAAQRLGVGSNGQILTVVAGAPAWAAPAASVTSAVAGTGISVSGATGAVTITNIGVTSLVAGTAISISGSTGAVTVNNTGVTSAVAGTGISVSGATGAVTFTNSWGAQPATTNLDLLFYTGTVFNRLAAGAAFTSLQMNSGATGFSYAASLQSLMTTTGDLVYASAANTPARLGIGTAAQVLTVVGGLPAWANAAAGFADPETTIGDMIFRNGSNVTSRLGIGTNGQILTVVAGLPAWAAPAASVTSAVAGTGITVSGATGAVTISNTWGANPATTIGDIVYANQTQANPSFTRLALGTALQVLQTNATATAPQWAASAQSVMTATGDILYASAANTLARLAIGTAGQVLTVTAGLPSWATGGGGGMTNPMTTTGDLIYSSSGSTPARLGIGTAFQGLQTNSGATAPVWGASARSTLSTTGDLLYASAANTLARLGIGTAGQVLTVAGGLPSWAAAPAATSISDGTTTIGFNANHHVTVTSSAAAPTIANTAASPNTAMSVTGTDNEGQIAFTSSATPASGSQVKVTYGTAGAAAPKGVLIAINLQNNAARVVDVVASAFNATDFTVYFSAAAAASDPMTFGYKVIW